MKKHTVIKQECKENRDKINEIAKRIEDKRKQEKMIIDALCTDGVRRKDAIKQANVEETFSEINTEINNLITEEKNLEEKTIVLNNNYHYAIVHEFVPIICEIMNKYKGKRVGEKTTEKIRNEFYERTGFRFYWDEQYSCQIVISNINTRITLYIYWENTNVRSFFVEELTPEKIKYSDDTYIEDIDNYIESIREERQQLKQAMDNLNSMIDKYNKRTVGDMHRYSRYYDR